MRKKRMDKLYIVVGQKVTPNPYKAFGAVITESDDLGENISFVCDNKQRAENYLNWKYLKTANLYEIDAKCIKSVVNE